jgi:hypothetical protein
MTARRSGARISKVVRQVFWRLLRWSGSRCISDSDVAGNQNLCLRRMLSQDVERDHDAYRQE